MTVVSPTVQGGRGRADTRVRPSAGDKTKRFQARMSDQQRLLFEQAASIEGRTMTEFVLTHAQEAAKRTIQDWLILRLSAQDSEAFARALTSSWEPSDAVRADVRSMRDLLGDD